MGSILAILLLTFLYSVPSDWLQKSIDQSEHYIEVISSGKNSEIHYWALTELFYSNCDIQSYILSDFKSASKYFKKTKVCENASSSSAKLKTILKIALDKGYYELFAYYLTQTDGPESSKELNKFINKWASSLSNNKVALLKSLALKAELDKNIFLDSTSPLIHVGLLTSPFRNTYYSNDSLNPAIEKWITVINEYDNKQELEYSIVLSNLIAASFFTYDDQTILTYGHKFIESNYFPQSLLKVKRINGIDFTNYIYGNYDRSLEIQRNYTLPLTDYLNEIEEKNKILLRHGAYLFALGKYKESQEIYIQLIKNSKKYVNNYTLLNNMGINYLKLGYTNKYVSHQLKALNQDISNEKSLLNIYRNIFIYYSSIRDTSSALNYIEKAKEVAENNSDFVELARIESFLGTFYWTNFKDHTKSIHHLDLAERSLSPEDNYETFRDLLIEKSIIYLAIDSLNSAKETINSLNNITLSKSDTPGYLHAQILSTSYNLKSDRLSEAEKNLNEINMHSLDNIDFELLTKYYTVKSEYLYLTGKTNEAIRTLSPVISQIINRTKNNTDSQSGYWSVKDEYLDAFKMMLDLHQERGNLEEVLILLDQLKTINDASLYNSPLVKAAKLSEGDLAEEKRLSERIQDLRNQYLNSAEAKRFDLKIEIDRLSAEREEILAKANLNKQYKLPPVWAVQRTINSDELVLHFTELGSELYVTYLTSADIKIESFTLDLKDVEQLSKTADNLASGETDLFELYSIYKKLDLADLPDHINHITVIPDNYLYRIPLEILPTQKPVSPISYGSAHYLLEDYHFRYFTSLQEFESNRRSKSSISTSDFTAFAISDFSEFTSTDLPSLPYATSEAVSINQVLDTFDNKIILTEKTATKQKFVQATANSKIVHVATHSEISEQNPLFSTIYLKGEQGSDSLESNQALYAYELFDTSMNSDFIMLNSCSSGSGNYMQGTGIMGISRALRYAGAKSLALNLWSVNDKVASVFATDFYSYINSGYTKSEAIRKAKLDQLSSANANPHFWGAYMMIGNPTPLAEKSNNSYLVYTLLFSLIFATGFTTRKMNAAA